MLKIRGLNMTLDHFSLKNINLDIGAGEYFAILGPSGAGKSLLLETIAGLMKPDSGNIFLGDEDISGKAIQDRGIGLVLQDGAIFPHMSVSRNISYSLKSKKLSKKEKNNRVQSLAKEVNIQHLLNRMPSSLSGGELQRVAIARTLANEPKCLLLDEPLASLDIQLKEDIRELLRSINAKGITILHVTHDYYEAFSLAGRMAIIDQGEIMQQGSPFEVFSRPGSRFVADFIGLKNYYKFKLRDGVLILDNKLELTGLGSQKESGHLLIPQAALSLIRSVVECPEGYIEGRVISIVRFPEKTELIIDASIKIHISLDPAKSDSISYQHGDLVWLKIDPDRVIIL